MPKIRVMIVEDSRVVREFLEYLINRDPRLEVAVAVESAEEALQMLERVSPDVISLDIRLPGMNGLEATQRIMALKPTPIVVVSASVEAEDLKVSMNALRAGALAVVEKPVGQAHSDYERLAGRLCTQLAIMSQVQVIRQRRAPSAAQASRLCQKHTGETPVLRGVGPFQVLGLVASTGGPNALAQILGALSPSFPLPVLLVQHMTASFLDGFVSWLGSVSALPVELAREGQVGIPGRVYVAPGDRHLRWQGRLRLDRGEEVCHQRPSGTVLFQSLARSVGPGTLAVLLTGMGEDGAEGLKAVRDASGYTIAEDQATAVVYGMPAAAVRLGAVCESLPLQEIAPRIGELVALNKEIP